MLRGLASVTSRREATEGIQQGDNVPDVHLTMAHSGSHGDRGAEASIGDGGTARTEPSKQPKWETGPDRRLSSVHGTENRDLTSSGLSPTAPLPSLHPR